MDMGAITGLITGVNGIKTIAQGIIAERDAAMIREKTTALSIALLSVLDSAIATQAEQSSLLGQIDDLKKKIETMKTWRAERERYELNSAYHGGANVLALKPDAKPPEPPHWICQGCAERGIKQVLQRGPEPTRRLYPWHCNSCKADVWADWDGPNPKPAPAAG